MRKALSILLVAGLLTTAMTGMVTATGDENDPWRGLPYYLSVKGTVVSIEDLKEGYKIIIEDADGNPAHLIVTDKTVFPFKSEVEAGDVVTGFYLANAPMILIWPPQYKIAVLVAGEPDGTRVAVDRFYEWEDNSEGYLLAKSKVFAFRVDENTEIILANGDDFSDGDYVGRRIAVVFETSTRSIPELTTASKLIVLYEDVVTGPEPIPEDMLLNMGGADAAIDASGWPILVDGVLIDAPAAFQTGYALMVPLRAIAEALGYEVLWDAETRSVTLDESIVFAIGNTSYFNGETEIELADAPALVDGFTYVPLAFFRDVLDLPNAFAFEGQIDIHSDGERME